MEYSIDVNTDDDVFESSKTVIKKGNSVIALPSDYVCIDIETTGLDVEWDDILELGAAKVSNGKVVDRFTALVYRSTGVPSFITELTGITSEMVQSADPLDAVLPQFVEFCGDSVLVGHGVNFDVNFVSYNAANFGIDFMNDYIDTLRIARKLFQGEKHHRLSDVALYCGVNQEQAHRAGSDVCTTIACFEKMKRIAIENGSEADFVNRFKKHVVPLSKQLKGMNPTADEIDDTNPFYGKVVVFTGALSRMGRKAACQIVLNLGGLPADSLTTSTNYLVIGKEEFASSVKNGKTKKMEKAEKYQSKGYDITVLSEDTFFGMIE